jgi:hypothetical protein
VLLMRGARWRVRSVVRYAGIGVAVVVGLALSGAGLLALQVLSREPLRTVPSTTHASFTRQDCIDCHAPIADEWRQSYHAVTLAGPYWEKVRQQGYAKVFNALRKKCVNCHAPADVLDLAAPSTAQEAASLGVECTPNLLREPTGVIPEVRADQPELGVDCTSCHVSRAGLVGSGRAASAPHEVLGDARFQTPEVTAERLCGVCHGAAVAALRRSPLADGGKTCLDCHMPYVMAPSVAGGPPHRRRSHRFPGDKEPSMLEKGLDASLSIGSDRSARVRIVNDRVGHMYPSGGNWVSVRLTARDGSGKSLADTVGLLGKDEALLFDFWPFNLDKRLKPGERREVKLALPRGHGTVEALVRYHSWMRPRATLARLTQVY